MSALARPLRVAWRENLDHDIARDLAEDVFRATDAGLLDLDADYDTVGTAAEVLWDSERISRALELAEALRRRTADEKLSNPNVADEQIIVRDLRAYRLTARVLLRARREDEAWHTVRVAYRLLRDQVGGRNETLSNLIAHEPFTGIGLLYAELLGIGVPVGRRLPESMRSPIWDIFMRDAEVIVRQIPLGTREYTHLHALVSQFFFAVLRRDDRTNDTELVQLLWKLDAATRPADKRGRVTRFLLYAEVSEYFGEHANAVIYRRRAAAELEHNGMNRHLQVAKSLYFPPQR